MAVLRSDQSGVAYPLLSRTLIGRSPSCALRLGGGLSSGEHALCVFTGGGWELRDLGSKNGTFVDGRRIVAGTPVLLVEGSVLGFGDRDGWTLVDASPPPLLAVDLVTAEVIPSSDGILVLPSEESPQVSVYSAGGGEFVLETSRGSVRRIREAQVVEVSGRVFRIEPPVLLEGTPFADEGPSLRNVTLRFRVSRNEEYVDLTIVHGDRELEVARRDHLYVLLTLARIRLQEHDLPVEERGWVDRDELCRMVSMEPNALDVAVHRARKQLARVGLEDAASIVEVRAGQRRIATDRLSIG